MSKEKESVLQHIAELEAELALKDFGIRRRDVCIFLGRKNAL